MTERKGEEVPGHHTHQPLVSVLALRSRGSGSSEEDQRVVLLSRGVICSSMSI
jgi:hypothetical protein